MNTITLVRAALSTENDMEEGERDAAANLLRLAEEFLTSLDLEQVGLDKARARREAREAA